MSEVRAVRFWRIYTDAMWFKRIQGRIAAMTIKRYNDR